MKLSIYEVYIPIENQEQADRMKKICIDYELPYWESDIAFLFNGQGNFCYSNSIGIHGDFALYPILYGKTQVTESEFLELVKILNKC